MSDDILNEFIIEAREILDQLDIDFVELEKDPENIPLVSNIFRGLHTLKGSSGFFALKRLEKVSHAGESLLGKIREGQIKLDQQKTTILLQTLDCLREIIEGIESTQKEPLGDDTQLLDNLQALSSGKAISSDSKEKTSPAVQEKPSAPAPSMPETSQLPSTPIQATVPPTPAPTPSVNSEDSDEQVLNQDNSPSSDQSDEEKIKVMIVDDSSILRKILESALNQDGGFEIVDRLANGLLAVQRFQISKPEVIVLDLEMPVMDGQTACVEIRKLDKNIPIIIYSSVGFPGSKVALDALNNGANAVVLKPSNVNDMSSAYEVLKDTLIVKLKEFVFLNRGKPPEITQNLTHTSPTTSQEPTQDLTTTQDEPDLGSKQIDPTKSHEVAAPVKVSLELLDRLMNLVSEMVLARNRLLPFTQEYSDHSFSNAVRTVDLLTMELQERMMKTRMQPISQVWSKFPRLVRDVATACDKKVILIQEGAETELDRSLLDAIRDPFVSMIRNSIDHGIEEPEDRIAAGKPEVGKVSLRAIHEGGMVVIEVADDGSGLHYDVIKSNAISKGFKTPEQISRMSDADLVELIFLPGFSTKKTVSNISGRGVGLDVVRTNIANLGGTIELNSERGKGTTIRLKLPLTLAIMPALFIRCETEMYAIPQNNILEMVRLDLEVDETGLEDFYGTPVFRLRDKLVPLIFLNQHLKFNDRMPAPDQAINIAILQSSGTRFGLVIDEVLNMQEVVVKSLGPLLSEVHDFGGATILGNGRVALILDVDGLAIHSGIVAKTQARTLNKPEVVEVSQEEETSMLLFELHGLEKIAIPLEYVERLEVIRPEMIQKNGRRNVVQYGRQIMELLYLEEFIAGTKSSTDHGTQNLSVIVHYVNDLPVGLVVAQVHDIIHVPKRLHEANPPQQGLLGCVLLNDRVINVIDVEEILMMSKLNAPANYPHVIEMDEQA
jgi:two-component system chemotaxis sensor kinase CheA